MSHGPVKLNLVDRIVKQGGRGQRKWNVWYLVLQCPVCAHKFIRLQNTSKGRLLCCVGDGKLKITKGQT